RRQRASRGFRRAPPPRTPPPRPRRRTPPSTPDRPVAVTSSPNFLSESAPKRDNHRSPILPAPGGSSHETLRRHLRHPGPDGGAAVRAAGRDSLADRAAGGVAAAVVEVPPLSGPRRPDRRQRAGAIL